MQPGRFRRQSIYNESVTTEMMQNFKPTANLNLFESDVNFPQ